MAEQDSITEWLHVYRESGTVAPMSSALAEKLMKQVMQRLARWLGRRITPKFGSMDSEDMAQDQFIDLMEELNDENSSLPEYVTDSKKLLKWMFRIQWRRFCRSLTLKRPELRGSSILNELGKDGELGMDSLPSILPYVERLDIESAEQLELALKDIERCCGGEALRLLRAIYLEGKSQTEVGDELGISQATVWRRRNQILFYLAKRMQCCEEELRHDFGEAETAMWSGQLAKGGRTEK
jgi:RNA polymerase sigma factor (sigma-70 family)